MGKTIKDLVCQAEKRGNGACITAPKTLMEALGISLEGEKTKFKLRVKTENDKVVLTYMEI